MAGYRANFTITYSTGYREFLAGYTKILALYCPELAMATSVLVALLMLGDFRCIA
jgi:hypothetical protein